MTRLLPLYASLALLLSGCANMQISDFEVMVQLPASGDCYGIKVVSKKETRYPKAQCAKMVKRAIILTSENYKLIRGDIQTNCQEFQCTQITGAADGLFLAIDKALQNVPAP